MDIDLGRCQAKFVLFGCFGPSGSQSSQLSLGRCDGWSWSLHTISPEVRVKGIGRRGLVFECGLVVLELYFMVSLFVSVHVLKLKRVIDVISGRFLHYFREGYITTMHPIMIDLK